MERNESGTEKIEEIKINRIRDYKLLSKFNLSFMVVFSSVVSYLLVPGLKVEWQNVVLLFIGGFLVTAGANAINQVIEKDTDALMKRTANRPIATGRMSKLEGWGFALVTVVLGVFILGFYFNQLAALVAFLSVILYGFVYTPLKRINSIAVLVGALPGALPCLIGWVAGAGAFTTGGWVIFSIQFIWQFPHFWAIAWLAHRDYSAAGFKLLPSNEGPTKFTALQAMIYSMLLIPAGFFPYMIGMSGMISMGIIFAANMGLLWQCVRLYREMNDDAARRIMFGSYIYLPIVLLALLGDKIG